MSLHRDISFVGHQVTESGGRATYWVGACECGWRSEERHFSSGSIGADGAHREYREHVEEALGADAYYPTDVACRNCGVRQSQPILVGTHVMSNACARCGMVMLSPDNETWHEDRDRTGWLFS